MEDNRLIAILQIFTIILVFKGISATYHATKYSLEQQLDLISHYAYLFKIAPLFFIVSLILISIPYFSKDITQKTKNRLDKIAILFIILGLLFPIIFF